jgi:hypothetical protein
MKNFAYRRRNENSKLSACGIKAKGESNFAVEQISDCLFVRWEDFSIMREPEKSVSGWGRVS